MQISNHCGCKRSGGAAIAIISSEKAELRKLLKLNSKPGNPSAQIKRQRDVRL